MLIKKQFYLLIMLVLGSVLLIVGSNYFSSKKIEQYNEQRLLLLKINNSMLSLRRHEKDFFARKNTQYVEKFDNTFQRIKQQTGALENLISSGHSNQELLMEVNKKLDIYALQFSSMSEIDKTIGLSPTQGIYGELRESVHQIEELLASHSAKQLTIDMLMLRRHEKDFMLRHEVDFVEKFNTRFSLFKFNTYLTKFEYSLKTQILDTLKIYSTKFEALVDANITKGLNEKLGLRAQMRKAVHNAEDDIEALEKHITVTIDQLSGQSVLNQATISFVLAALILFFLLNIFRSITVPVIALRHTLNKIAESGKLNFRIENMPNNEIGEVGDSINKMLNAQQRTLQEVTKVASALADGNFETRISGNAQGDFADLKKAVNRSCDNIEKGMSRILQVLANLQLGNFKQPADLTGLEGSFLSSVKSANDTMVVIDSAITDISSVMNSATKGDFNHRVKIVVAGDLALLKNNINVSMDAIEAAVIEIVQVSTDMSRGYLKQKISNEFQGQLALIITAIQTTLSNLQQTVGNVHNMTDVVQSGAGDIVLRGQKLDSQIASQVSALHLTTKGMQQLALHVQENVQSAENAKSKVTESLSQAKAGLDIVKSAVEAMHNMQKSSVKITEIINVINDISFQSKILALNATVEAARSKEGGKGFTVVAREVGVLANRTSQAAKDVRRMINENSKNISSSSELVKLTGASLQQINTALVDTTSSVTNINNASISQVNKIKTAQLSISTLEKISNQNAKLVSETSTSILQLNDKASQLTQLMAYFKLEEQPVFDFSETESAVLAGEPNTSSSTF